MGLITGGTYNWNIFVSGTNNRGGLICGGREAYTWGKGGLYNVCGGRGAMCGEGGYVGEGGLIIRILQYGILK